MKSGFYDLRRRDCHEESRLLIGRCRNVDLCLATDGLQSLRTGLLSVGRKSFEHDLAARPAALDQRVSLLQIGRVDGAQRFRQRRLDHSGIDKLGHFRNRDRSIQDDHPDGVQAANDTCDLIL